MWLIIYQYTNALYILSDKQDVSVYILTSFVQFRCDRTYCSVYNLAISKLKMYACDDCNLSVMRWFNLFSLFVLSFCFFYFFKIQMHVVQLLYYTAFTHADPTDWIGEETTFFCYNYLLCKYIIVNIHGMKVSISKLKMQLSSK